MEINPEALEFSETVDLDPEAKEFKTKLKHMLENNDVVAIGSKQHLEALKKDLILAGYKKMK